jgi:hypothetical protein
MNKQRLLRALILWIALVMIPTALILTGRIPGVTPWIINALSVISLIGVLAIGYLVLAGRGIKR